MSTTASPQPLTSETIGAADSPASAPILDAAFAGVRRVPEPINDPNRSYAPGTPERAELKARLKAMAAERIEIPLIIGGKEIRTGRTAQAVMPHDHSHVLADYHLADADARAAGDRRLRRGAPRVGELAVGRSRRGHPARGGAAGDQLAPDDRRGDDARTVEDGVPGGDRRGVGDDRLLALQRLVRAGALSRAAGERSRHVEPDGVPRARGLRLRHLAVQLHRHRRQPHHRAGADGQHDRVEARRRRRC